MTLLIKNATIVNADETSQAPRDILIEGGKIARIAPDQKAENVKTVDAKGKLVLPGLIDIHVHLRAPGQEHKETVTTGCRAAARGGFTTVMCMPNTVPVIDNGRIVESIIDEARRAGLANVVPIGAITRGQDGRELTDMFELKEAGCRALSDDGKSVVNSQLMRRALEYSQMAGLLLIQHCEDPLLSQGGVMNESYMSTVLGMKGHPGIAESVIVARDIELAHYLGGRVHFAHMSLRRCVELIRAAKAQGIAVTAEACPHHFTLTDEALKDFDTNTKMNPPLRTRDDVEAIKEGLADGTIDCVVTDHAPHTFEDKEVDFDCAPFGIIGLETSLGLTIKELVAPGILNWNQVADRMSASPARITGMESKGRIREGFDADITIVDPDMEWTFRREDIASKSKNSPFIGWEFKGGVWATICNGKITYQCR